MTSNALCRRCGVLIEVNPSLSMDVFEGMHWLCFHLEYEHDGDPDVACEDLWGCPWRRIESLEEKLRELGVDPDDVVTNAIERLTNR